MTGRWGPAWEAVSGALGSLGWRDARPLREVRDGGYSPASRWVVERADGARAFLKARAVRDDGNPDGGFEAERIVCESATGPMVPVLHGWSQDEQVSLLVLEDLSDAHWGTPVDEEDAHALREALDALADVEAPANMRSIKVGGDHAGEGWGAVRSDPGPLVELGLLSQEWLDRAGELLLDAAGQLEHTGDGLVHGDLWRQNWCRAARGAVLVDWTGGARGHARANHAWAEAGVRAAGGPAGVVLEASAPDHAAWASYMAGLAAAFLAEDLPDALVLPRLHATQVREAIATIDWACDALELDRPTYAPALLAHGPWQP